MSGPSVGIVVGAGCVAWPAWLGPAALLVLVLLGHARGVRADTPPAGRVGAGCPPEMVSVGAYCVDRWEASMVDRATGEPLSPHYPPVRSLAQEVWLAWELDRTSYGNDVARAMPLPELSEWQRQHRFEPRAVSRPGVVPQAFVPYPAAKRACENAGKRLCTRDEWVVACQGAKRTKFPYGEAYEAGRCNLWRNFHPGLLLHESAIFGHRDPRLNLVVEDGTKPLLRVTGGTPTCASRWNGDAVLDMVGNIDEWVEGKSPEFVGGFYARATRGGCEARVTNHASTYYDYSLGVRCCRNSAAP